jgi:hypothetical protein
MVPAIPPTINTSRTTQTMTKTGELELSATAPYDGSTGGSALATGGSEKASGWGASGCPAGMAASGAGPGAAAAPGATAVEVIEAGGGAYGSDVSGAEFTCTGVPQLVQKRTPSPSDLPQLVQNAIPFPRAQCGFWWSITQAKLPERLSLRQPDHSKHRTEIQGYGVWAGCTPRGPDSGPVHGRLM